MFAIEAERVIALLRARKMILATAESCSGGLLAGALTAIAGSSECFGYGLITYSNAAKQNLLQVPAETLTRYGAVSAETAAAMARGVRQLAGADIGIAITGIAGPGGGSADKPVGLVYMSLSTAEQELTQKHNFSGERAAVRAQSVTAALGLLLAQLTANE